MLKTVIKIDQDSIEKLREIAKAAKLSASLLEGLTLSYELKTQDGS